MSDISQISVGGQTYKIKDELVRDDYISKTAANQSPTALLNFINGLKVNGNYVISQATADVTSVPSNDEPSVEVSVSQYGVAHFSFSIPKPKVAYISASFTNQTLSFDNQNEIMVEFVNDSALLGTNIIGG